MQLSNPSSEVTTSRITFTAGLAKSYGLEFDKVLSNGLEFGRVLIKTVQRYGSLEVMNGSLERGNLITGRCPDSLRSVSRVSDPWRCIFATLLPPPV